MPFGGASDGKDECMSVLLPAAAAAVARPPNLCKRLLPAEAVTAAAAVICLENGKGGRWKGYELIEMLEVVAANVGTDGRTGDE